MVSYQRCCANKYPFLCHCQRKVRFETFIYYWGPNISDWFNCEQAVVRILYEHEQLCEQLVDRSRTCWTIPSTDDSAGLWWLRKSRVESRASSIAQMLFKTWSEPRHPPLHVLGREYDQPTRTIHGFCCQFARAHRQRHLSGQVTFLPIAVQPMAALLVCTPPMVNDRRSSKWLTYEFWKPFDAVLRPGCPMTVWQCNDKVDECKCRSERKCK